MVITEKEYTGLCMNSTGEIYVYVRQFPNQFLNPGFEKYEFSFQELDWHERDVKRCFKAFLFMLITFEAIICMIAMEA